MDDVKIYWSDCGDRGYNFGDEYAGVIVEQITGRKTVRVSSPMDSEIVTVGSILHHISSDYDGYIWGSGFIADYHDIQFPYAQVRALRGKLTARRVGVDVPLGDPLLVLNKPNIQPKYELGILSHYVDHSDIEIWKLARTDPSILVIDICARDVVERIASCKRLITSSLHGLVIADALGVPNMWTLFSEGKISGGSFKFRDYYSVFGIDDPIPYRYDKSHTFKWILGYLDYRGYEPKKLDTIRRDLLQAFPSELRRSDWESYDERNQRVAAMVAPGSTVLDLGAGQMTLRKFLRDCEYQPCDYLPGKNTLFCDYNFGVYPQVTQHYDYVVCAGLLEYVRNPAEFLKTVFKLGDTMLFTYSVKTPEQSIADRERSGWVNHFTREELDAMLKSIGLQFAFRDQWGDQLIGYLRELA